MKLSLRPLHMIAFLAAIVPLYAAAEEGSAVQTKTNVFWSGHSLTDPPIPQMLADISAGFDTPMNWNRHSMAGASMEARTRGRPPNMNGWDGYRQGNNRDTVDMDVIEEFRSAATVGGNGYDVLVVTEVHSLLYSLLRNDSVRLLRHYYERFREANPDGRTFFYHSWLDIVDKQNPQSWMDYERAAEPLWQCLATRVNTSLEAEGRSDRVLFLPAGLSLVSLAERAISAAGVPGITADTTTETLNRIFRDTVHLTDTGSYYIALVSYAFISGKSPVGGWQPEGISTDTAQVLQKLAWQFYTSYRDSNAPLTLEDCSARIRDGFAARFWQLELTRQLNHDIPWYTKLRKRLTMPYRIKRNTRIWQESFADDSEDNPLNFDPASDADYWHPAP